MPELPEVETVARGLQKSVAGRRIVSVRLGKTDFIDDPAALEQQLPGRQIEKVERYGKFMLLRLSADSENGDVEAASLLVHLGMTGQLAPYAAEQPCAKHTHVWFGLDDGRELRYTDPRRFGRMAYLTRALLADELTAFRCWWALRSLLRESGHATRRLRRCCWIRACCAASATFTRMRVCGGRRFIQCGGEQS
jgi:DNA-formamidopyrimidine glycosylase